MELNWKESIGSSPDETADGASKDVVVYLAELVDSDDLTSTAIECVIDKAVSLLDQNIRDESMYFLFEWDSVCSMLTVVVTDKNKEKDSPHVVKCSFAAFNVKINNLGVSDKERENNVNEYSASVKFWIKDYLSICTRFFGYSLIAIFHNESRETTQLL